MLRELAWGDLPRLAELELEAFAQDAWTEATWWSELAGRPRREYVVWDDPDRGGVVGYAGLDHGGDVADVMTIAVAPAARGLGLGRRLLHELVARATAGERARCCWRSAPTTPRPGRSTRPTASRPSRCAAATTSPATSTRS